MKTRFTRKYLCLLLAIGGMPLAHAQSNDNDDSWRFQATPYVWMSGMEGQVRPFRGAPMADV
ncbi:MAG TPA: hypothetical protein VF513_07380, partial [Stenotrophomonas sp.]